MNKVEHTGSQLELTSLMTEYENQFDRSNKLDNNIYHYYILRFPVCVYHGAV